MTFLRNTIAGALVFGVTAAAGSAAAQIEGPVEFVIPFGAGGGADIEGRLLAEEMGKAIGVTFTPVNRPGGGGAVTYTYLHTAPADGSVVAWNSTSVLTSTNIGNTEFPYTALDHIGRVEFQPQPFVVAADSPYQTFQDFVDACHASPGNLKVANSSLGSSTHTAAIMLMDAADCEVIHLPKGIRERNASVLSGEADAMIAPLTGAARLTRSGELRMLVMPTGVRNAAFPDVPTANELGYDAELDLFRGLSVPPGTPDDVKQALADAMIQAANSPAFQELAENNGFTVAPLGVAEFELYLAVENEKVERIFESAGLLNSQ